VLASARALGGLPLNWRKIREDGEASFSPFAKKSADTLGRLVDEEKCPIRTDFERDHNRILYSVDFRRLRHKTQVFFNAKNDHICTRMEHVLYVGSIASTIARSLNLNQDLAYAIALGHDLGHAPFGHTGERVLNKCVRDIDKTLSFEHETHSLRVVDKLATRRASSGGMQSPGASPGPSASDSLGASRDISNSCGLSDSNSLRSGAGARLRAHASGETGAIQADAAQTGTFQTGTAPTGAIRTKTAQTEAAQPAGATQTEPAQTASGDLGKLGGANPNSGAKGLNLTFEVRDGIACHCGERYGEYFLQPDRAKAPPRLYDADIRKQSPATLEGCVVRIADKIAYVGRDIEDAVRTGIISMEDISKEVLGELGFTNGQIINTLVSDIIENSYGRDAVGLSEGKGAALESLINENMQLIYHSKKIDEYEKAMTNTMEGLFSGVYAALLKGEGYMRQANERVLRLFYGYIQEREYGEDEHPAQKALDFVAGMTDSFAIQCYDELYWM
jgi:dGTP triphosphohydrolase